METMELAEQFEFREIRQEETEQAVQIEQICFPPHEACSRESMQRRIAAVPELFLVAVDRTAGRIAGFLNGISTEESIFRDEFFTDETLYDPKGKNVMLLGLDVLPEYRGRGLAKAIVSRYIEQEKENGRQLLILTCLEGKVQMYQRMGFVNQGISGSAWGGEEWYDMTYRL